MLNQILLLFSVTWINLCARVFANCCDAFFSSIFFSADYLYLSNEHKYGRTCGYELLWNIEVEKTHGTHEHSFCEHFIMFDSKNVLCQI